MKTEYDSTADTLKHIKRVAQLLTEASAELIKRANVHDDSFDDKSGELIVTEITLIEKLKQDLKNVDSLFDVNDRRRCTEIIHEWIERLEAEKVSGEAKTPDLYSKEKLEEITNAGDLFGGLSGHEVDNLNKCEICYNLADKYFGEGGVKMHAVDFAHFVIGQLKLVKEPSYKDICLTCGYPRGDHSCEDNACPIKLGNTMNGNVFHADNRFKDLTSGYVPTPSDEQIEDEANRMANIKATSTVYGNLKYDEGFQTGAKWVKEWLRGSTEQERLGKEGNKG